MNGDQVEKILVVEDEPSLREALAYYLTRQGYSLETASDGKLALEIARKWHPDLIVLDVLLPYLDGFEVTRILRQESNVPIIFLTARDEEIDRVIGLEMGADDYLTKPFSMRELLARVKAHLRRVRIDRSEQGVAEPEQNEYMVFGNLELDLVRREVRLNGKPLNLKPMEYKLLIFMAMHRGQVLSRELMMEQVWGWDYHGGSRTVDVHVRWLREKIEPDTAAPTRIITVRGGGYRFDG